MDSGKVDGKRLCATGGSAGGFTTLAALAFKEIFKAGASLYGVSCLILPQYEVFARGIWLFHPSKQLI